MKDFNNRGVTFLSKKFLYSRRSFFQEKEIGQTKTKKGEAKTLRFQVLGNLKKSFETSGIDSAKAVRPQKTVLANAKRGVTLETAQTLCCFRGKRRNF